MFCPIISARRAKIIFTDHKDVIIWYECEAENASGLCSTNHVRLEVLQRTNRADGNLYLVHKNIIRSLCIDPKLLKIVTHDGMLGIYKQFAKF